MCDQQVTRNHPTTPESSCPIQVFSRQPDHGEERVNWVDQLAEMTSQSPSFLFTELAEFVCYHVNKHDY